MCRLCKKNNFGGTKGNKGVISGWQPGTDDEDTRWRETERVNTKNDGVEIHYFKRNVCRGPVQPALKYGNDLQRRPISVREEYVLKLIGS